MEGGRGQRPGGGRTSRARAPLLPSPRSLLRGGCALALSQGGAEVGGGGSSAGGPRVVLAVRLGKAADGKNDYYY